MNKTIAFISDHASPLAILGGKDAGGQNVYVNELAKKLVIQGYHIDIFTRWDDKDMPQIIHWLPGVRVIHIKAGPVAVIEKERLLPFMPEFSSNMQSFMEKEGISYDLIHAHFFMSGWVASEIKRKKRIPYVMTFHALGYIRKMYQREMDKFPPERISIEKDIIQECDAIVAECPQDKENLIDYYSADPAKISIIPCGFDPDEFYPVDPMFARKLLGFSRKELLLLQLGRMVPRKGVANVIHALSVLRKNRIHARLLIVGGGSVTPEKEPDSEINRLKSIAREEKVDKYVSFAGRKQREQLKYYYSAADLFISTPWYEPFGITPLEAMACRTPVIGSEVGGLKYTIIDQYTGLLVPPEDPLALAEKGAILLSNNRLAKELSENAIRRVHSQFTWKRVACAMTNLYEEIVYPVDRLPGMELQKEYTRECS